MQTRISKQMKSGAMLTTVAALSALVTFVAASAPLKKDKDSPNSLTRDKAAIERTLRAENARLAAVTDELESKLEAVEAKSFVRAQAAWVAWRDAEAEYLAHRYAPSTASSPELLQLAFDTITSSMKIEITESRVKRLEGELSGR
jgi:uncharacterized protein YecT (DUF1311 family)